MILYLHFAECLFPYTFIYNHVFNMGNLPNIINYLRIFLGKQIPCVLQISYRRTFSEKIHFVKNCRGGNNLLGLSVFNNNHVIAFCVSHLEESANKIVVFDVPNMGQLSQHGEKTFEKNVTKKLWRQPLSKSPSSSGRITKPFATFSLISELRTWSEKSGVLGLFKLSFTTPLCLLIFGVILHEYSSPAFSLTAVFEHTMSTNDTFYGGKEIKVPTKPTN